MTTIPSTLVGELAGIVGPAQVLTEPDLVAGYVTDWTGRWTGRTAAVVRPASTAEVARILATCHRLGVAVVPQGGNTGLVGGSIPMNGEVVLSSRRLATIEQVDPVAKTIAAGAGVTVAQARRAARAAGLDFGVDLASRDTATLGGIVATNAGGLRMIKHGNTRSQLLGVEAVRSDGRIVTRWKQLVKDNAGYDLPGLLAGSEGTLAVLTRVLMKLVVPASARQVVMLGVSEVGQAVSVLTTLKRRGLVLEAAELMTGPGMNLVLACERLRAPLTTSPPGYLLVEVSGVGDIADILTDALATMSPAILDMTMEPAPAQRLWRYREAHTEVAAKLSATRPIKLDLAAPLPALGEVLDELNSTLAQRYPGVRTLCFGHIGDGNVHVNLLDVPDDHAHSVIDMVLCSVARHDGSISAEHGIGRLKAEWIGHTRTPADIDLMRDIRRAFDPGLLLNPGVLPK
ncbi:FAD-binding oxidoreductase [Nocardia sp. NPDC127579]|uniref:FAD-binding oxidoreductase n=1 Tax=Nocardia sp. NPDC127579 TaxID=3345402 RepID=UPI0036321443